MNVALDLDSTVFDFHAALATFPGAEHVRIEDDAFYGWLEQELGREALTASFEHVFTPERMRSVGLIPGALDQLTRLADAGVRVHVMTRRDERYAQVTEDFLREQGVTYESFNCQYELDKIQMCGSMGIEVIVDDHPQTLQEAHEAGLRPLTLRWPYNAAVVDELQIPSALTWAELGPLVLQAAQATEARTC